MCHQCDMIKANMRERWIKLHLEQGISLLELSRMIGLHRNTLSNWKNSYLKHGLEGLVDKSKKPHSHPAEYDQSIKNQIKEIRLDKLNKRIPGPIEIKARLFDGFDINASRSGIAKCLKREGLIDPTKSKRNKKKNRLKKCKIKELGFIQMDVKYAFKSVADYWYYQYSSIDYLTGVAHGNIYEVQSNFEGILFTKSIINFYPFLLKGIQTDNHSTFTNRYTGYLKSESPLPRLHAFDLNCQKYGIEHYLIDKGKPGQNGKVERFHRTCEQEFYQQEKFKDLNQARKKFRDFLYYYNHERRHQGLNNLRPIEKLRTIAGFEHVKELKI
jgi:transposase